MYFKKGFVFAFLFVCLMWNFVFAVAVFAEPSLLEETDELKLDEDITGEIKKAPGELGEIFIEEIEEGSADDMRRGTLLPGTEMTVSSCETVMRYVDIHPSESQSLVAKRESVETGAGRIYGNDILGCAIKTGDVHMWMIPFFIRYILEFVVGLAGLVSVGVIVYGGYLYIFSAMGEEKDKGKNAIKNGIIGIVLTLTAWAIVNIVMALLTN